MGRFYAVSLFFTVFLALQLHLHRSEQKKVFNLTFLAFFFLFKVKNNFRLNIFSPVSFLSPQLIIGLKDLKIINDFHKKELRVFV